MTLAPAFGQALPTLERVATHYDHEVNAELLYKLCAALAVRGLGSPETWRSCGRNSVAFAQHSIMAAIGVERVELLRRNVELRLEVSDIFMEGYNYGSHARAGDDKLCVTISCTGAGYLKIGPALDALEREAEGLGAAFYWSLVHAIYRVMRMYDHEDAMMYEEMLRESANEDDEENRDQYEFPEVRRALPSYIEQTLARKWKVADKRPLHAYRGGPYTSWIRRLRRLEKLARLRVAESRGLIDGNYDGPPLPSLILAFQDHDAIVACFDEESQHMLESTAEPALCVVFSPEKPDELENAIRAVGRFVAFNAELYLLAEELVNWEERRGCEHSDRRKPPI